ncbi:MAG TPA: arginine deiminase-related protein [Rudaea sp.]|jgi:hypothetical protein|nr:arginine deiminase-related protein [Rudaea sp.]
MIVTTARDFLAAYSPERFPPTSPPTARAAFLVAPTGFSLAQESAGDNRYMAMQECVDAAKALAEHAELAARLRECVPTIVFPGDPQTPDAVFPNNAFGTVPGKLIVGAMRHPVRKRETVRSDIRSFFRDLLKYEIVDLSTQPLCAELTGSLVIDHARSIGFCGLSERCDMDGARAMHEAFGLKLMFCFALADGEYHTNVVLAILASRAAIIAPDGFANAEVAVAIGDVYAPRTIMLDTAQKNAFAANAISLSSDAVWMSERAAESLTAAQRAAITQWDFALRSVPLGEIEKAGGSLRCCVGEIF